MAKGQTGGETTTWVPSGLKVRGSAPENPPPEIVPPEIPLPENSPIPRPDTVSMSVLNSIPHVSADALREGLLPPPVLTGDLSRRSSDRLPEPSTASPKAQQDMKPGFRPMPVLTFLTLICLGILFWLGQWQWVKFVDKSKAPTAIAAIEPTSVAAALEAENPEYRPVIVEGLIDPRTIKISTVQGGVRGYRLFSPVILEVGGIFVDRGFVGEEDVSRLIAPTGQVRLNGVLRKGAKPNTYTPDNDIASDVWYWPDLTAMADMLVIQTTSSQHYVALTQVDPLATGNAIKNPYADSKGANQVEPERHLGYALTWWGFGLALIGVYIGLHVRTGRLVLRRTTPS